MQDYRTERKKSSKGWLLGLGIGCGALVLIVSVLMIGGFFFVKNIVDKFKETESITNALKEKYGMIEEYCPECWAAEKTRRHEAHQRSFICELCGAQFSRRASTVKRQEKLGLKIRWCSKRCQGEWLATRGRLN